MPEVPEYFLLDSKSISCKKHQKTIRLWCCPSLCSQDAQHATKQTCQQEQTYDRLRLSIRSPDDMLKIGLGLMGWETVGHVLTNIMRFKAHFESEGIFAMFYDLKEAEERTDPRKLLMALNFLKCCETEPCMASRWRLKEATVPFG
jgi:hypothetical protein